MFFDGERAPRKKIWQRHGIERSKNEEERQRKSKTGG
jgi:hypothetical protein